MNTIKNFLNISDRADYAIRNLLELNKLSIAKKRVAQESSLFD